MYVGGKLVAKPNFVLQKQLGEYQCYSGWLICILNLIG